MMDKMPLPHSNKSLTERRIYKGARWTGDKLAGLLLSFMFGFSSATLMMYHVFT